MSDELHCVVEGCDASITEETEEEVFETAEEYATKAHLDLELDEETIETVRENIEEVCPARGKRTAYCSAATKTRPTPTTA